MKTASGISCSWGVGDADAWCAAHCASLDEIRLFLVFSLGSALIVQFFFKKLGTEKHARRAGCAVNRALASPWNKGADALHPSPKRVPPPIGAAQQPLQKFPHILSKMPPRVDKHKTDGEKNAGSVHWTSVWKN